MTRRYMLGAYWAARKESVEQCADRLHVFLADLATCDPALATWYERGRSRKEALEKRADVGDQNYLLSLLDRGRNRRDIGRTVIEELGFGGGLWNGGKEGKEAGLSVKCGLYWASPKSNASMSNCVILDLPEDLGELNQTGRMARVLVAAARAWEPDWAGVMSKNAMSERAFNAKVPFVDWMVFVPRKISGAPSPSSVVELRGLGSLVIVQPVAPSGDPEELPRIHQAEKAIFG